MSEPIICIDYSYKIVTKPVNEHSVKNIKAIARRNSSTVFVFLYSCAFKFILMIGFSFLSLQQTLVRAIDMYTSID